MVEKGLRVLLRLCPSLRDSLMDCPGIERELEMQPKWPTGTKRAAEMVVSPVKKVIHTDTVSSVQHLPKMSESTVVPVRHPGGELCMKHGTSCSASP
jgi:hypothetical protein